VTVSETAGQWFASVLIDVARNPYEQCRDPDAVVGVDLGVKRLATLSNGEIVDNPKALRRNLKKLKRLSRNLSRKVRGSANYGRAKTKLAKLHCRIANLRKDTQHKPTTDLAFNYGHIVVEDLNVSGMMKNRKLSRAIADAGFYLFRSMLVYKTTLRNSLGYLVDRFFPSTQMCCDCGERHPGIVLGVDVFTCPSCGASKDRDLNAALNLRRLMLPPLGV